MPQQLSPVHPLDLLQGRVDIEKNKILPRVDRLEHRHAAVNMVEQFDKAVLLGGQFLFRLLEQPFVAQRLDHLAGHARQEIKKSLILDQVIGRPQLHHLDRHPFVSVAGDDDKWHLTLPGSHRLDNLLAAHVGQPVIENDEGRHDDIQPGQGILTVFDAFGVIALVRENPADKLSHRVRVIDDKNGGPEQAVKL